MSESKTALEGGRIEVVSTLQMEASGRAVRYACLVFMTSVLFSREVGSYSATRSITLASTRRPFLTYDSLPSSATDGEEPEKYKDESLRNAMEVNGDFNPRRSRREYWLDLRESAVMPNEALQFLEWNTFQESEIDTPGIHSLVDKVLLSEDGFYRSISSDSATSTPLLYTTANGSELVANDIARDQSFPIGTTYSCKYMDLVDPLLALDATSNGGWFLVDAIIADEPEVEDWLSSQISSLAQLLASASPTTERSEIPGLILPSTSRSRQLKDKPVGGLAVTCRTRATLLRACSVLSQTVGASSVTTTTESGILVPTGQSSSGEQELSSLRIALVLPLDVMLWETAGDLVD